MDIIESIASVTKAAVNAGNHELFKELQFISEQAYKLQKENNELKNHINSLEKTISDEKIKVIKDGCYYFGQEGPYCTRCHDVDGKKVLMKMDLDNGWGKVYNECPNCKNEAITRTYKVDMSVFSSKISYD